jgi:hypothetical protein
MIILLLYGIGLLIVFYIQDKDRDESIYSARERKVKNTWAQETRKPGKLNTFCQIQNQVYRKLQGEGQHSHAHQTDYTKVRKETVNRPNINHLIPFRHK